MTGQIRTLRITDPGRIVATVVRTARPTRPTSPTRAVTTRRAIAVTAAGLAGVAIFASTRADAAAPATTTGDITMTVVASNGSLRGDSGTTFYVDSYAWGAQVPVTRIGGIGGIGGTTSRPADQTLTLGRPVGAGSAALLNAMAANRRLDTVDIRVSSRSGAERPTQVVGYKLENCRITDLKHGADSDAKADEKVSILCQSSSVSTLSVAANGATTTLIGRITAALTGA